MADPITPDDVEGILRFDSAYIGDSVRAALDLLSQVDDHHVIALRDGRLVVVGLEHFTKFRQRHERGRIEVMQHGEMWMDGEWLYRLRPAECEHSEEGRDGR